MQSSNQFERRPGINLHRILKWTLGFSIVGFAFSLTLAWNSPENSLWPGPLLVLTFFLGMTISLIGMALNRIRKAA